MKSEELLRKIGSVDDRFVNELFEEEAKIVKMPRKTGGYRHFAALAASLAIVLVGGFSMYNSGIDIGNGSLKLIGNIFGLDMAQNSVIMIDVNPSIRIEVNDRDEVVKVEAINDDASELLVDVDVVGSDSTTAVKATVGALCSEGYITDLKNSLLVTVVDDSEERAAEILESVVSSAQAVSEETGYGLSILTQILDDDSEFAELSQELSLSTGRVWLLEKFSSEHSDFDFEELAKNNVHTLNQLFEYTGLPKLVERIGAVAGTVPEDCIEKLGLDDLSFNELLDFNSAISQFYDRLCEYYSESDVAQRIGYAFDIVVSENPDGGRLWAVLAESLNNNVGSHGAIINRGESDISDWFTPSSIQNIVDLIDQVA